jgi:lysyl-tRNA synthetase class 2
MTIPYSFPRDASTAEVIERFSTLEAGEESGVTVAVAGRVMLLRSQGKLAFAELRDSVGASQLFALSAVTEDFEGLAALKLGDWVGATGEVVRTKRGELSVKVATWVLLADARRGFGDKWHGVTDTETRYRQREVDLWANEESRARLVKRSTLVRSMRERLWDQGFLEVETPILNPIAGGATAKPFVTHHNALDADFYLRVAPELYLKRLVVGGFERVFELGRLFRNEGISPRHNPEFTTVEAYAAYMDCFGLMDMVEELVAGVVADVLGTTTLTYQGQTIEMGAPWRRGTMAALTSEQVGQEVSVHSDPDLLRSLLQSAGEVAPNPGWGPGKLLAELFEATTEQTIVQPTFVTEHPAEVSPLARRHRDDPDLVERFEVIVVGRELINGFSELQDPDDQRQRFEEQAAAHAAGDDEAMLIDHEYLRALEHGLPPTAGVGIGIDRLAMLVADAANIREVIAFPTLKPLVTPPGTADTVDEG